MESHRNGITSFVVNYSKNVQKCCFFEYFDFNLNIFCNFLKNVPEYIDPTGQFVFYGFFVAQTPITYFFRKVEKLNISAIFN